MTKKDLSIRLAERANISTPLAIECVEAMMQIMAESFEAGHNITLRGFGVFKVKANKHRHGRDFHSGKQISLPPKRTVKFVAYNDLKHRINGEEAR